MYENILYLVTYFDLACNQRKESLIIMQTEGPLFK